MNENPAVRKRNFLLVCRQRAKSNDAEILKQKKPRAKARGVSLYINRSLFKTSWPAVKSAVLKIHSTVGIWKAPGVF